jgi:phytoene synthase
MVKKPLPSIPGNTPDMIAQDPERALALSYAEPGRRAGLAALLALDDALGQVLRTTREPALGQIRLVWWRDRLTALDTAPPPAEPVLEAVAGDMLSHGVQGEALAEMAEGWALLLEPELDEAALLRFADARGGTLFAAAGNLRGAGADPLQPAGQGWALADLAANLSDPEAAAAARRLAAPLLAEALASQWSRPGRPLGALAHLARLDLAGPHRTGSPRRVARLLWHRLTGQ